MRLAMEVTDEQEAVDMVAEANAAVTEAQERVDKLGTVAP